MKSMSGRPIGHKQSLCIYQSKTAHKRTGRKRISASWLLLASLTSFLAGCQTKSSTNIPKGTPTADLSSTSHTAEIYDTPPALTIVSPEGMHPDNSAFIQVAENSVNVTQVAAEDVPGSTLIYRLQDGEDRDKFLLDENTGTLRFKEVPDWEDPKDADANNNYMLLWQVLNSNGDARSQFLVVQVTDLPE